MNSGFRKALTIICFLLFAKNLFSQTHCTTNRFTDIASFDSTDIRIDSNIVYGVAINYFTGLHDTLIMDVFYPDTSIDTMLVRPFILLIHGGSFIAGSRRDMDYQCMEFARRGFVTATIRYRLGWNCSGTDFFSICLLCGNVPGNLRTATYQAAQDGRAAMRYIHANTSPYRIDTANYFTGGTSAGSITALHTAFWNQQEANSFCPSCELNVGLLDTSGNALPNGYTFKGVIDNCGGISNDSAMLDNALPVISFHDEGDCIVPTQYGQVISCACQSFYWVAGSSAMHNFNSNHGNCSSMNLVPLNIAHCSYPQYELVNRAACFMKSVMCGTCTPNFNNTPFVPQGCNVDNYISEEDKIENLSLVPNPANEFFYVEGLSSGKIQIFDLAGRKVHSENLYHGNQTIRTSDLIPGLYIFQVTSNKDNFLLKLLISR